MQRHLLAAALLAPTLAFASHPSVANKYNHVHTTTFAPATAKPAEHHLFDGFNFGLSTGILSVQSDHKSESTVDLASGGNNPETFTIENQNLSHDNSPTFRLQAGYGKSFHRFYLAGSLYSQFVKANATGSASITLKNTTGATKYVIEGKDTLESNEFIYGAQLKTGYLAAPNVLSYFSFGYVYNRYTAESTLSYIAPASKDSGITHSRKTKGLSGFQLGAGLETQLSNTITCGLEYLYTFYNSTKLTSSNPIFGAQAGDRVTQVTSFKPSNHQILLTLNYHFAL